MLWRRWLILLVILALAPGTWLRTPKSPGNNDQQLLMQPLLLPQGCCQQGAFTLTGAWQLRSANDAFGGYSALLMPAPGQLLALSDRGNYLSFAAPDQPPAAVRIGDALGTGGSHKAARDIEAATRDPHSGALWLALEGRNAVLRTDAGLVRQAEALPLPLRGWPSNTGPEAMVRLADGRFIVLSEASADDGRPGTHPAVLFAGDPTRGAAAERFTLSGPAGYRPTDMAQLPDGRVLILLRRLLWPVPARFTGSIAIADPAAIARGGIWRAREVARLRGPLPLDNYEGMALAPLADGRIAVWLISDDNGALSQRTLLLRLVVDPARL